MRNKLILFICLIALPLIAHTQKQSTGFSNSKELDSLSLERRLVILGVKSLDYYVSLDKINNKVINSQREIIELNEVELGRKEAQISTLNESLDKEIRHKKKWRKATLYSVGLNAIFLGTLYVLSR
jgi:hypothetical protein